jgi:Fe(3+) dicitrate transport protein
MPRKNIWAIGPLLSLALAAPAFTTTAAEAPVEEVVVVGSAVKRELADVEGAKIYAGKRPQVAVLSDLPALEGTAQRQAFSEISGVLISEVSNNSWASISYRGMGEPHESWNVLILKDGVPVSPDMVSYPAAYYVPPLDVVSRIEVLQGGAGLLYGPQPGGVINFVSQYDPGSDYLGQIKVSGGDNGARAGLIRASLGDGPWRLSGYGRIGQSDGPRRANSDSDQRSLGLTGRYGGDALSVSLTLDAFDGDYGEPGGLSRARFDADRRAVSTALDRIKISRTAPSLRVDADWGDWRVEATGFAAWYQRTSKRQTGGAFGQVTPAANVLIKQTQEFETRGLDLRVRRDFDAFGSLQSATFGALWFDSDAPVFVDKGASPTDQAGTAGALARTDRSGETRALFGEVRLGLGPLIITPGVRVENVRQDVRERLDLSIGSATGGPPGAANGALSAKSSDETVTLWGLGAWIDLNPNLRLIGNVSTGYKPKLYNDGVTFQAGIDAAPTFEPTRSLTAEAGFKARPTPWSAIEALGFFVRLEDQVGLLGGPLPTLAPFGAVGVGGARRVNVGTMENSGIEISGALALFGPDGGPFGKRDDQLRLQANAQVLNGEFVEGAAKGFTPQYAPDLIARASLVYSRPNGAKAALFLTQVSDQSGVDNNVAEFAIPAYTLVDASVEWPLTSAIAITGALNNIFDESYIGRIRPGGGGGIDPGAPRNVTVGLNARF